MGEKSQSQNVMSMEDLLAALDRERAAAHELNRRHSELVRASRARDCQIGTERHRHPAQ